jgi:PAS domain S-box-containing protein
MMARKASESFRVLVIEDNPDDAFWVSEALARDRRVTWSVAQAGTLSEERYRQLVEGASDIIYRTDELGYFTYVNRRAAVTMGYSLEDVRGVRFLDIIRRDHRMAAAEFYAKQALEEIPSTYFEFPAMAKDGREVWIGQNVQLIPEGRGFEAVARDISERKKIEFEREELIAKLQTALLQVKTLSGLLPVCASCKKIRNDNGYWSEVEHYIREHTDATFSHGICPECAKRIYPELYGKRQPD